MAKFYVIGTPIGNMEDITFRAVSVLKSVGAVLCEDTRVTAKLLRKYGSERADDFLSFAQQNFQSGKDFRTSSRRKESRACLGCRTVISDPGCFLSHRSGNFRKRKMFRWKSPPYREPSALTAALSVSGFPASDFLFLGFLPHKKGRETLFREIAASKRTAVFYESPHRILKTLESLSKNLGSERKIAVARELTQNF